MYINLYNYFYEKKKIFVIINKYTYVFFIQVIINNYKKIL